MTPRNRTPNGGDGGDSTPGRPKDGDGGDGPSKKYGSIDASNATAAQASTRQVFDRGRASQQQGGQPPVDPNVRGPAGKVQLRPPNNRHNLNQIGPKSRPKDKNTVILPDAKRDVQQDLDDIQTGKATWDPATNSYVAPSGRRYKVESNGTVFPVDGPGFVQLNRPEYKALQALIAHNGDVEAAKADASRDPNFPLDSFDKAGEVYQHYKK
jgi:hypothetical protein